MKFVAKAILGAFVIGLLAVPAALVAQGVDGKWTAEIQGGRGPQTLTISLKAEGGKLTGTIEGAGRGGPMTIDDGTFEKGMLKFTTKQAGRDGGQTVLTWTGALKGDEIAFKREGGRGPLEFVAKRAK